MHLPPMIRRFLPGRAPSTTAAMPDHTTVATMPPETIQWGPSRRDRATKVERGSLTVGHQYLMYSRWSDGDSDYQQFTDGITALTLMRRENAVLDRATTETKSRVVAVPPVQVAVAQEPGRVRATVTVPDDLPTDGLDVLAIRLHVERAASWVRSVLSAQHGVVVTSPDAGDQSEEVTA